MIDDDRARLLRGIRNGLLPSLILWALIIVLIWWIIRIVDYSITTIDDVSDMSIPSPIYSRLEG